MEEQRKAELEDKRNRRSDLEEEQEQQEKQKVLQRARRMRLEQDEEIRELNAVGPALPAVTWHCLSLPCSSGSQALPLLPLPSLSLCPSAAPGHRHLLSPQLFLNAKCNMIRDKQVLEKQLIHKELAEEEKRLEKMMEMERDKGMEAQEELERHRKQELMRWAGGSLFSMEASCPFQPHQLCPCQRSHNGEQDGARGKPSALVFPEPGRTL